MVEKSLIPFDSRLIPTGAKDQPIITGKQHEEVIDTARMYLRRLKTPISSSTLEQAIGVMGDAVRRGLEHQNRQFLEPKDKIRPLAANGLELREDLRRKAETSLASVKDQTTYAESILAIPFSLIQATRAELRNFPLTAEIKGTEQIVYLSGQRQPLIDKLAQIGLDSLPEILRSQVLLNQFKDFDKPKLIRNMIASFVFRGNLSPYLSIQDLKNFVSMANESQHYFTNQSRDALIVTIGQDQEEIKSFISDLFTQTAAVFSTYQLIPQEDNLKATDSFYRKFVRDLLLLHPALEEQQIVIDPEKVSEGQPSLWDKAAQIGQIKVASPQALIQAIRQVKAGGGQLSEERLQKGLKEWKLYDGMVKRHNSKLKQAEEMLKIRQQLLDVLDIPHFSLPKEAYEVKIKSQEDARSELRARENELRRITRIINQDSQLQKETQAYEFWLGQTYGNQLPQFLPMPRLAAIQKLTERKRDYKGKQGSLEYQLAVAEKLEDLNQVQPETLTDLLEHVSRNLPLKPNMGFLPRAVRESWSFWAQTSSIFGGLKGQKLQEKWEEFAEQAGKQRNELLSSVLLMVANRDKFSKEYDKVDKQLKQITDSNQSVLPDMKWSKDEALAYLDEVKSSALPDLAGFSSDEILDATRKMRRMFYSLSLSILPARIPEKDKLREYLMSKVAELESPPQSKIRAWGNSRIETWQDQLADLMNWIDHPLFPLPEGTGLKRAEFIRAWRRRVDLSYAVNFSQTAHDLRDVAFEHYEDVNREIFKQRLSQEIASQIRYLNQLRERDLWEGFVEKMRSLKLVLEVDK